MRWTFDNTVRRLNHGTVLIGGSPLTVMRLSVAGRRVVDRALSGAEPSTGGERSLIDRLVDGGLLLAEPSPNDARPTADDVSLVLPVRNDPASLDRALDAIDRLTSSPRDVVIVDDASGRDASGRGSVGEVARRHGARVIRLDTQCGPAAARAAGVAATTSPIVAFVDADVIVSPDWLDVSLAHLVDERVAVVAPRVVPIGLGADAVSAYERERSALDLGPDGGLVRRGSRLPYVPSAALVVRRDALVDVGGFDPDLRVGEDVDLVWRLADAGWRVRYCGDSATVGHRHRREAAKWARRRFDYGTSAAPLERRHPGSVRPLGVSTWSAAAWLAVAAGHRVIGVVIAAGSTAQLARTFAFLDQPMETALAIAGRGNLRAGESIARSIIRPWWPLATIASVASRRARGVVVLAAVVPPLLEWSRRRPDLDPIRWTLVSVADDVAYSAGVWVGCVRAGTFAAILPKFG